MISIYFNVLFFKEERSRKGSAKRTKMEVKKEQNKQGRPILKQCTVCTGFDTEGEWRKSEIA